MRKLLTILLMLSMLMGCGNEASFDAKSAFKDASKAMESLNALTNITTTEVTIKMLDDTKQQQTFEMISEIKADGLLNDDLKYQMSFKTNTFGEVNELKQWYEDGIVYTVEGNHHYALTIDQDELDVEQDDVIQGLEFDDALEYQGKQDGNKKIITISLNEAMVKDLLEDLDLDVEEQTKQLKFSDVEVVINEDGYFESEKLNISFVLDNLAFEAQILVEFKDYNSVTIDEFDKTAFNNIDNVLDEPEKVISEALIAALEEKGYQAIDKGIFIKEDQDGQTYALDLAHQFLIFDEELFDLRMNTFFDQTTSCIYDFNNNLTEGECDAEALQRAKSLHEEALSLMQLLEQ